MYSEALVLRLIGVIYDAALQPALWSGFLDQLAQAVDGHSVNLALAAEDSQIDPWFTGGGDRRVSGAVDLGDRIVSQREYGSGQFGAPERQLIRALLPHLQRAMQVRQRLTAAEMTAVNATSALDQMCEGVIFLSADARVQFANQAADAILRERDGLLLERGELRGSGVTETNRLHSALGAAAHTTARGAAQNRSMILVRRPSGRRPLAVLVTPLATHSNFIAADMAAVAMSVANPECTRLPHIDVLRLVLGLTSGEARLARCLVAGQGLDEAARSLSIGIETARKRLKVLFQKTDTHRQADLVRLLLQYVVLGS